MQPPKLCWREGVLWTRANQGALAHCTCHARCPATACVALTAPSTNPLRSKSLLPHVAHTSTLCRYDLYDLHDLYDLMSQLCETKLLDSQSSLFSSHRLLPDVVLMVCFCRFYQIWECSCGLAMTTCATKRGMNVVHR